MSPAGHHDALGALAPVSLVDLTENADLRTRQDRKYLIAAPVLPALLADLPAGTHVLDIDGQRSFRYATTYFDTPELDSYLSTARRRARRFKVRTRSYLDSDACVLEVKTRDARHRTVKHRYPYDVADRHRLTEEAHRFIEGIEEARVAAGRLTATLVTTYQRETLLLPGDSARVTIDIGLECRTSDDDMIGLADLVLVETKTPGPPCPTDRALWRLGCRPVTISKYCVGLAALYPTLPANKWNRVLRRHFDWAPHPPSGDEPAALGLGAARWPRPEELLDGR